MRQGAGMTPTARRRATPAVVPAPETPSIFTRIGELAAEQQGSLLAKKIDLLLTEDPGCAVDILMNSGAMRYFSASTTKRWNPPFGSDARPSVARSFARAWTKRSTGGPAAAQAYEALVDSWITSGGRGQHSQASDTGVGYRIGQEIAALDRTVWWRAHAAGAMSLSATDVKALADEKHPEGLALVTTALKNKSCYLNLNVWGGPKDKQYQTQRAAADGLASDIAILHAAAPAEQRAPLRALLVAQGKLWKVLADDLAIKDGIQTPIDVIPLDMPSASWNRSLAYARAAPTAHRSLITTGNPAGAENNSSQYEKTSEQRLKMAHFAAVLHRGLGDTDFDQAVAERFTQKAYAVYDGSREWDEILVKEMTIPSRDALADQGIGLKRGDSVQAVTLLSRVAGSDPVVACDHIEKFGAGAVAMLAAVHGETYRRQAFITLLSRTPDAEQVAEKLRRPAADLFGEWSQSRGRSAGADFIVAKALARTTAERSAVYLFSGVVRESEHDLPSSEGYRALVADIRTDHVVRDTTLGVLVHWMSTGCPGAVDIIAQLGDGAEA